MMDPAIISMLLVGTSMLYGLWRLLRKYWETAKPFDSIPMAQDSHWFFGQAMRISQKDFVSGWKLISDDSSNEFGQVGFWLGGVKAISVSNWKDARDILSRSHGRRNLGLMQHYMGIIVGSKNMLLLNGREWKLHRTALTRTLDKSFLDGAREDIVDVTTDLINALKDRMQSSGNIQMDVLPLTKMITIEVFGRSAFKNKKDFECCRHLTPTPVTDAFDFLTRDFATRLADPLKPANFFDWIPTSRNVQMHKEVKVVRSFLNNLASVRRSSVNQTSTDMLARLFRAHVESKELLDGSESISDQTLSDVMMTILFAGYDTTSTTLTYALYYLSTHPEVQEHCAKEVLSLESCEKLEDLPYVSAVVNEVLRLQPSAPLTTRYLEKSQKLSGGLVAPKDTLVFVPIWSIHHDEKHFPLADEFRPDRWVRYDSTNACWAERNCDDENKGASYDETCDIAAANHNAFFPFSAGARNCPGQKFATVEAVLSLANLVRELAFHPVPGYKFEIGLYGVIQMPVNGMPLRIEARNAPSSSAVSDELKRE